MKAQLTTKVKHAAAAGLRRSPRPLRTALARGSQKVVNVLGPAGQTAGPVWTTPPLPVPSGQTAASIDASMRTWSINGEPVGHMDDYVNDSFWRFLYTWSLVRDRSGRCLELGGNPYFTSVLLDRFSDLDVHYANYYGERGQAVEKLSFVPPGESERIEVDCACDLFNVEEDPFPYEDDSFDVVLFCEMLEHLLMDPTATLRQIHRVLKPGGTMVLTTPNVARIGNVMALASGANIYDPYSGYGPYGRHNREYTRHELHRLLEFTGFEVEQSFTADGHPTDASHWPHYPQIAPLLTYRQADLGHYLFIAARATSEPREGLPSFLFRSRPPGEIVDFA